MEEEKLKLMIMTTKRRNAAVSCFVEEDKDDDVASLPGFRFHPTDEELVGFYLRRKVEKKALKIDIIKLCDVYKYQPWELPRDGGGGGEREMYYFCRRGRKYKNSVRPNRVTAGCGFWKATGIDKSIYSGGECVVGLKKSLVYYRGSAGKGTKTDWMMHEFRLPPNDGYEAEVWTLCGIFKREASCRKYATTVQQRQAVSDRKRSSPVENHGYYSSNDMVSSGQLMAMNYFDHGSSTSAGDQQQEAEEISLEEGEWDELRPMVDFALLDHHHRHSIFFT